MGKKTSNYLVSTDTDIDRKSVGVVGKVRANWTGSGYHLYDHGMNPAKSKTDASIRRDLGFVSFDYDTMGPGKMEIAVPRVTTGGVPVELRPRSEEDATSEQLYKENNTEKLMTLTNKRPKWDETVKGHVLNFQGRVTMSSVKNFQLACSETGDLTVLQFGRVGDNKFTMDYRVSFFIDWLWCVFPSLIPPLIHRCFVFFLCFCLAPTVPAVRVPSLWHRPGVVGRQAC